MSFITETTYAHPFDGLEFCVLLLRHWKLIYSADCRRVDSRMVQNRKPDIIHCNIYVIDSFFRNMDS